MIKGETIEGKTRVKDRGESRGKDSSDERRRLAFE